MLGPTTQRVNQRHHRGPEPDRRKQRQKGGEPDETQRPEAKHWQRSRSERPCWQRRASLEPVASDTLLSAALGGLLCIAPACASTKPLEPIGPTDSGTGSETASDPLVGTDAAPTCDAGVIPDASITSAMIVPSMTLDMFTSQCLAQNGMVEISPHCGASNSCRGMSYDIETETLTQHTCQGTNTCGGYSCVICD